MLEHASYKMTKQRKYLQIVNNHGLLTAKGCLIFYKQESQKIPQNNPPNTTSGVITNNILYKLGNFSIALDTQACIFSTRCQTTNNFWFI